MTWDKLCSHNVYSKNNGLVKPGKVKVSNIFMKQANVIATICWIFGLTVLPVSLATFQTDHVKLGILGSAHDSVSNESLRKGEFYWCRPMFHRFCFNHRSMLTALIVNKFQTMWRFCGRSFTCVNKTGRNAWTQPVVRNNSIPWRIILPVCRAIYAYSVCIWSWTFNVIFHWLLLSEFADNFGHWRIKQPYIQRVAKDEINLLTDFQPNVYPYRASRNKLKTVLNTLYPSNKILFSTF